MTDNIPEISRSRVVAETSRGSRRKQMSTTDDPLRLDRFAEFEALETGWLDGYGQPIHPVPIARAKALLGLLDAAGVPGPGVFPMEEGGVSLEWVDDRSFLGLELLVTGEIDLFTLRLDEDDEDESKSSTTKVLADVVEFVRVNLSPEHDFSVMRIALCSAFRNFRMVRSDVADQPVQAPIGLLPRMNFEKVHW